MAQSLKILGPPGCGKTERLLKIFEYELRRTAPDRLAFLTFTRAARHEAQQRVRYTEEELPYLRTIHSLCFNQLKARRIGMMTSHDLRDFGRRLGLEFTSHEPVSLDAMNEYGVGQATKDDVLLQLNHVGRQRMITLNEAMRTAPLDISFQYAAWLTKAYRKYKNVTGLRDFTDLLTEFLERGTVPELDVLIVDEAQDLSKLQWEVIRRLAADVDRCYYAGDDEQAIFNWAGADADQFINLAADEVEILNQSYRVPRKVHKVADTVRHRIKNRLEKIYTPRDADGEVIFTGILNDAEFKDDTFILFRNHFRGRELAQQLRQNLTPYLGYASPLTDLARHTIVGWQQVQRDERLDRREALALVASASPPLLTPHAAEIAKSECEPRELFNTDITRQKFSRVFTSLPNADELELMWTRHGETLLAPRAQLLSIHQSKGRQVDTVVVDPTMARKTYEGWEQSPDEEHRTMYVAVTRTRERLLIMPGTGLFTYPL